MAATMVREEIYEAFLGAADRAFYYGHSYTANQLGCAAALASLDVFKSENTLEKLPAKVALLSSLLARLERETPEVHEIRQCGMVAGIELRNAQGERFAPEDRIGEKVSLAARDYGLLIRPILDTLVIMPPLSISHPEIESMCSALRQAIHAYFSS